MTYIVYLDVEIAADSGEAAGRIAMDAIYRNKWPEDQPLEFSISSTSKIDDDD